MALSIVSLNVNGLNDATKRKTILNYLNNEKYDFCLLQETHLTEKNAKKLHAWPGSFFHAAGKTNSAGVAILTKIKRLKPVDIQTDDGGRYIVIQCSIDGHLVTICNLYAPSGGAQEKQIQRKFFFEKVRQILSKYTNSSNHIIMAGDFNTTLHPLDRTPPPKQTFRCKSNLALMALITSCHLVDVWRKTNPTNTDFTYMSNTNSFTRIDRIYISKSLLPKIIQTKHKPNIFSDHHNSPIIQLAMQDHKRGPGIWILNNSLLNDNTYTSKIANLWQKWEKEKSKFTDIRLWWEDVKNNIKQFTQKYCKIQKKQHNKHLHSLHKRLRNLNRKLTQNPIKFQKLANTLRRQILTYEQDVAEGARIRSKIKWKIEGEKCTKFFFNLEKQSQAEKSISKLKLANNQTITNPDDIINEIKSFYEQLYAKQGINDPTLQHLLQSTPTPKISNQSKQKCDLPLTEMEMKQAIFSMEKNKSPGSDGLTVEFYQHFWELISPNLTTTLKHCLKEGELTPSQREALITCIYKKGPREEMKNWRPISLLNTDYKILTKTLTNRLISSLPDVIHDNQAAAVPNRSIIN